MGHFATDTLGQNFKLENCLIASQLDAFLPEATVIENYLNGQNSPPIANGDPFQIEVKAEIILREDGHWLLDLSGEIPDSLKILEITQPQLRYLRTAETSYYPIPETVSWQADLIKKGHFTAQLQGYPEVIWDNDLGKHRSYPVDNPQQAWNIQRYLGVLTAALR